MDFNELCDLLQESFGDESDGEEWKNEEEKPSDDEAEDKMGEGQSDIDPDFIKGETNFPYGHGFPNSKRSWEKVVHISSIAQKHLTEEEKKKLELSQIEQTRQFIAKIAPRLLENKAIQHELQPADYFSSPMPWGFCNFLNDINPNYHPEYAWKFQKQLHDELLALDPNLDQHVQELLKLTSKQMDAYFPSEEKSDIENPANYPVYVTLYDVTRLPGGHEEGGWWYDHYDQVKTVPASNYAEVKKIATEMFKDLKGADLNGQPKIIVVETPGTYLNNEPPSYS